MWAGQRDEAWPTLTAICIGSGERIFLALPLSQVQATLHTAAAESNPMNIAVSHIE